MKVQFPPCKARGLLVRMSPGASTQPCITLPQLLPTVDRTMPCGGLHGHPRSLSAAHRPPISFIPRFNFSGYRLGAGDYTAPFRRIFLRWVRQPCSCLSAERITLRRNYSVVGNIRQAPSPKAAARGPFIVFLTTGTTPRVKAIWFCGMVSPLPLLSATSIYH